MAATVIIRVTENLEADLVIRINVSGVESRVITSGICPEKGKGGNDKDGDRSGDDAGINGKTVDGENANNRHGDSFCTIATSVFSPTTPFEY